MKTRIIGVSLLVLAISFVACKEEPRETQVWGKFFCDQCTGGFIPEGTLGTGGQNYFGWCRTTETGLDFIVAEADPTSASFSTEFYFELNGVEGPANVGVYDETGMVLDDPNLYTTFSSFRVKNGNEWELNSEDLDENDACRVRLFAEAGEEELTPADDFEGEPEPFEYFVLLECTGLSVPSGSGVTLTGTTMRVWFDECD